MGFPTDMFTVSVRGRGAPVGWIAQWKEMIQDPEQKIGRPPASLYNRATRRGEYKAVEQALRPATGVACDVNADLPAPVLARRGYRSTPRNQNSPKRSNA